MKSKRPQNWSTPDWLFEPIDRAVGGFTLDVCASRHNAKAPYYYDKTLDGLKQDWTGRVWCNPPYKDIPPWLDMGRAYQSMVTSVFLLPGRIDQDWFHEHALSRESTLIFIRGRVAFEDPTSHERSNPYESSILIGYGPRRAALNRVRRLTNPTRRVRKSNA